VDSLGHDLLLLMLNLSRIQDRERIVRLFEEALSAAVPGVTVRQLEEGEDAGGGEVVEVATPEVHSGRLVIDDPGGLLSERDRGRFRNAIRMLAVVLENVTRAERLAAANHELEAFAYSVSHDLRAPLRHVDGYLGLLRKHLGAAIDDRARQYLDTVSGEARRMDALIQDLLAFSRMGRAELARESVELGPLVREVVGDLTPETAGRDVRWAIAELPAVCGDRAMLRAAFANLLRNALKFTRPRPRAEIEVRREPADAREVVVSVRDNGVGFDMAHAGKLFGAFQRLHRADEFEGTGIGLANVRRIVERHGGRAWAEGELGKGACFYLSLPSAPAAANGRDARLASKAAG
jgi:light-regulated signal transduction histidine kinase (bacteriophytochrome)